MLQTRHRGAHRRRRDSLGQDAASASEALPQAATGRGSRNSIVKAVHSGRGLEAGNQPGQGSTFRVMLPRRYDDGAE